MESDLRVRRKPDVLDLSTIAEELPHLVTVGPEGNVTDKEGAALGADDVAVLGGPVLGLVERLLVVVAGGSNVQPDGTVVDLLASHGVKGRLGSVGAGEVDEAEATAAATLAVGDNAGTNETVELGELPLEPLIVDVPAELANPDGRPLGGLVSLGLLRGSVRLGLGLVELALPGRLLRLGLLGVVRVRVRAVRRVIRL